MERVPSSRVSSRLSSTWYFAPSRVKSVLGAMMSMLSWWSLTMTGILAMKL